MAKEYKPLPDGLTIKKSAIPELGTEDSLGLFATQDFPAGHNFGIGHVQDERFPNGYIRTPLGGFFNQTDDPNCEVVHEDPYIYLKSLKSIKAGDELTAIYTLYDPTK